MISSPPTGMITFGGAFGKGFGFGGGPGGGPDLQFCGITYTGVGGVGVRSGSGVASCLMGL